MISEKLGVAPMAGSTLIKLRTRAQIPGSGPRFPDQCLKFIVTDCSVRQGARPLKGPYEPGH